MNEKIEEPVKRESKTIRRIQSTDQKRLSDLEDKLTEVNRNLAVGIGLYMVPVGLGCAGPYLWDKGTDGFKLLGTFSTLGAFFAGLIAWSYEMNAMGEDREILPLTGYYRGFKERKRLKDEIRDIKQYIPESYKGTLKEIRKAKNHLSTTATLVAAYERKGRFEQADRLRAYLSAKREEESCIMRFIESDNPFYKYAERKSDAIIHYFKQQAETGIKEAREELQGIKGERQKELDAFCDEFPVTYDANREHWENHILAKYQERIDRGQAKVDEEKMRADYSLPDRLSTIAKKILSEDPKTCRSLTRDEYRLLSHAMRTHERHMRQATA